LNYQYVVKKYFHLKYIVYTHIQICIYTQIAKKTSASKRQILTVYNEKFLQKTNNFHTESVISGDVGKLLSKMTKFTDMLYQIGFAVFARFLLLCCQI